MCNQTSISSADGEKKVWLSLLTVLAHDISSPLTAMRWQTELLLEEKGLRTETRATLSSIHDSILTGIDVSTMVALAVSVLQGDHGIIVEKFNPIQTTAYVVAMLTSQFERHNVTLEYSVENVLVSDMQSDPTVFKLAVWALLKYTLSCANAGSTVPLSYEQVQLEDGLYVRLKTTAHLISKEQSLTSHRVAPAGTFYHIFKTGALLLSGNVHLLGASLCFDVPLQQ